jgi:hypothetical protein
MNTQEKLNNEAEKQMTINTELRTLNMRLGIAILFVGIVWSIVAAAMRSSQTSENPQTHEQKVNLFEGYSDQNFALATAKVEIDGDDTTIIKKTISDLLWAKLELYPTIGAIYPTLFYIKAGDRQIKTMEVSEAKIIE